VAQTASDYYLPLVEGNYVILHNPMDTQGLNYEYLIKGSDVINGKVYFIEEGSDYLSLFRALWLRKDSVGEVVCGAVCATKPITPIIDSATIMNPIYVWFPNQFLTPGYSRYMSDYTSKDSVLSITETVNVPAGIFTNCILICETNLDNLGIATRREYDYYAKGIGVVKAVIEISSPRTLELIAYKNVTSVRDNNIALNSNSFTLEQNYPNPWNPTTTINYSLAKEGNVKLTVYNAIGSKVATIVNEYKTAGNYSVQFNGSNLASGIYLYRLESGNYNTVKKFVLIK
jgi:hypothetical protein